MSVSFEKGTRIIFFNTFAPPATNLWRWWRTQHAEKNQKINCHRIWNMYAGNLNTAVWFFAAFFQSGSPLHMSESTFVPINLFIRRIPVRCMFKKWFALAGKNNYWGLYSGRYLYWYDAGYRLLHCVLCVNVVPTQYLSVPFLLAVSSFEGYTRLTSESKVAAS